MVIVLEKITSKYFETEKAILSVNWADYETAYGNADKEYYPKSNKNICIPKVKNMLIDLFSDDKETQLKASHNLWCSLCHQHVFISSAALPSFDILFFALENSEDDIKVEILDIFLGFAVCVSNAIRKDSWEYELRIKMINHKTYFEELMQHSNEDIAYFSNEIINKLL